jgi:hypothetical protein
MVAVVLYLDCLPVDALTLTISNEKTGQPISFDFSPALPGERF